MPKLTSKIMINDLRTIRHSNATRVFCTRLENILKKCAKTRLIKIRVNTLDQRKSQLHNEWSSFSLAHVGTKLSLSEKFDFCSDYLASLSCACG